MIGEWIRFCLVAVLLLAGLFTLVVALIGLFRFDFALNRIHAAAMADTLALLLFLAGAIVAVGFHAVAWKLALVVALQWCTSPLASHMLAKFEFLADENLAQHVDISDAEFTDAEVRDAAFKEEVSPS